MSVNYKIGRLKHLHLMHLNEGQEAGEVALLSKKVITMFYHILEILCIRLPTKPSRNPL